MLRGERGVCETMGAAEGRAIRTHQCQCQMMALGNGLPPHGKKL